MSEPGTDLETALKRFAAWKHYRATGAVQWENDELKDGMLIFEAYAALEARCRELEAALDAAAYALFQIKRMAPEHIVEHSKAAYAAACVVLNGESTMETAVQPAPEVSNYLTHKGRRMSDSSLFDEICDDCGARDYSIGPDELTERPCTPKNRSAKP